MSIVVCHNLLHFVVDKAHIPNALYNYSVQLYIALYIASDIRGLLKCSYTELKNFTIALSVFMVVESHILNKSLSNFIMFH